ncbi:hypothetical protein BCR35DRAFT_306014 [Leucosporidium creatinivorum]|uniref:Sec20 C-terminal domain-containing protein n=1 Tax=Leucosporidium creatinivorum TaxID=106004 RepID=A0A1Y2EWK3_9BASI|nr:hypothetical protein BCR35DRAFT_306014 [Leucosporidium creatinivorum]
MPPPAHTPLAPPRAAPPPPTLPDELLQLVASLANRLNDLESHQLPQLTGANDRALHDQLANDARRELGGVKRDVEELKLQVDDLQKSRDRRAGADHVVAIQLRLDAITKLYRQSVIASSRLIEAQQASSSGLSARDELFASANKAGSPSNGGAAGGAGGTGGGGLKKGGGDGGDDALMSATSDVTEGLRRTLQLMQQEVDRSAVSNELLESQTATLALTSEQYSLLGTLLTTSKALITTLARADLLDRLLLAAALLLFGLVCAYVVKRRVVDKGLRIAGALTGAVGRGGGEKVEAVVKRGMSDASVVVERASTRLAGEAAAVTTAVLSAVQAARTVVVGGDGRAERAAKAQERIREEQRREREEEEMRRRMLARREEEERKAAAVNEPEPEEVGGGLELEDMLEEGVEDVDEDEEFEEDDDEVFEPEELVDEEGVIVEDKPVNPSAIANEEDEHLPRSITPILPTEGATTFTDEDGVVWDLVPGGVPPIGAKIVDDGRPSPSSAAVDESTKPQEIPSEYPSATDPSLHAQDEPSSVVTSSSAGAQPSAVVPAEQEEEEAIATASAEPEFETPTPAETLVAPSPVVDEEQEEQQTVTPSPSPSGASAVSEEPTPSPSPIAVVEPQEENIQEPIASTTIEEPLPTPPADAEVVPEPSSSSSPLTTEQASTTAEPTPSSTPSTTELEEEPLPTADDLTDADLGLDSINLGYGGQPIISVFRNATPPAATEVTTAEEIIFTPLERLRPATPEVGDRDKVVEENRVGLEKREEEGAVEVPIVEEPVVEKEEEPSIAEPTEPEPTPSAIPEPETEPTPSPSPVAEPLPSFNSTPEPELEQPSPATTFTDSDGTVWDLVPGGILPPGAVLADDGRPKDFNPASRKGGYKGFEMLRDYEEPTPTPEELEEMGEWEDYAVFEGEEYELELELEDEDEDEQKEEEPPLPEPATNVGSQRTSVVEAPVETAAAPVPVPEAAVSVEEGESRASQTPAPVVVEREVVEEPQQDEEDVPSPAPSATIEEPAVPPPVELEEPIAEPTSSAIIEEPTASPLPSSSSALIPEPTATSATVDSTRPSPSPSAVDEPLAEPISPPSQDQDEQIWTAVPGGEGKFTKDDVYYPEEGGITAREKEAMELAARLEKQRQEKEKQPLLEVPEVVKRAEEERIEDDVLEGAGEVERATESAEPEMEGSVELPVEELEKAGFNIEEEETVAIPSPSSSPIIVAPSSTVDPSPATPSPPAPIAEPILPTTEDVEDDSTTFEDILSTPDAEEDDIAANAIDVEEDEALPLESDEYLGELEDEVEESEGEEKGKVFRDEL